MTQEQNDLAKNLPSITSSAMLGTLSLSVYEGWKRDSGTAEQNRQDKGARSRRANSATKNLFSECAPLEAIKTKRNEVRNWFNKRTLPWSDNGDRLITVAQYFEVTREMAIHEQDYKALVTRFLTFYPQEISKQAFSNGGFFNRDDYPTVEQLHKKFAFRFTVAPLPVSGDFRVDISGEARDELCKRYEEHMTSRIQEAVGDAWERVKERVLHIQERMAATMDYVPGQVEEEKTLDADGNVVELKIITKRRPKLYESLLTQGLETCAILSDLNVTNDPNLEEARKMLEDALVNLDIKSLRESPELQSSVKTKMQAICDKFDF